MLSMPKIHYREDARESANPYAIYTRKLKVGEDEVLTDPEGYILNMEEWSEGFAVALAAEEKLTLTSEHWEVIRFIRQYYDCTARN